MDVLSAYLWRGLGAYRRQRRLQRSNFKIIGSGLGVHWPDIDEDISATGMLFGIPARPRKVPGPPETQLAANLASGDNACLTLVHDTRE